MSAMPPLPTKRSQRLTWSTPLPRPIKIPQVMTLKTLADVRKLIGYIPKERRELSTWHMSRRRLEPALPAMIS
jgi:hypothetical protein